jgi:CBS domain-containing protein
MPVGEYCNRKVSTIGASASLRAAAQQMESEGVGCLVVLTGDTPTGFVTDRDVALRVLGEELDPDVAIVGLLLQDRVAITVHDTSPLRVAGGLMRRHGIRRLPVVDRTNKLVGIITADDLLRVVGRELAALGDAFAAQAPGAWSYGPGGVSEPEVE